jgi:zinc protease
MARFLVIALGLLVWAATATAATVEKVISPKGIEAWLIQDHSNPILSVEVAFEGGASQDADPKAGLADMVASLLDEGAGPYDSRAFQQKLEDLVITLHFTAGRDSLVGQVRTLSLHRDTAFDLLRLAITQPRFDKEAIERIRAQMLAGLAQEEQSPNAVAGRRLFQTMFPGHAYGRSPHGSFDTVKTLQGGDLRAFARGQLARDRLRIGIAGDITPEQLAPLLDATFGALPAKGDPATVPDTAAKAQGGLVVVEKPNPQTTALFALPGLVRNDPDWYAAYVMNAILGGSGFSSWLTETVREKRGLAYSVYSYLAPMRHGGLLLGGVATENARFGESMALIRSELARMRDVGPSDKELADAKTYLNGSFPLQLDSTGALAGLLVQLQLDRLGMDFMDRRAALIDAVTQDDIRRVAKRLLVPDQLTVVAVGKI